MINSSKPFPMNMHLNGSEEILVTTRTHCVPASGDEVTFNGIDYLVRTVRWVECELTGVYTPWVELIPLKGGVQ